MSGELAQLNAKVDVLTSKVTDLVEFIRASAKPMTQVAFAARIGKSRSTVARKIDSGEIITKSGLIPPSELKKFGL